MIYPKLLEDLIDYFKKFPGVGEKSAERFALAALELNMEDVEAFSKSMLSAKKNLHPCSICGNLTDEEVCSICSNISRNKNLICVVEDYKSIFIFEKMGKYSGVYHVLNGLISPINGVSPNDINISLLVKRIKEMEGDVEVIIALKPTIEGETTTQYINKILAQNNVSISRLSYGLPVGTEFDYLDSLTLERAFDDRKNIS